MIVALIVLAVLSAVFALTLFAPQGAVFVGLACLFAILARIAQAGEQHAALLATLRPAAPVVTAAAPEPAPEPAPAGPQRKSVANWEVADYVRQGWRVVEKSGVFTTVEPPPEPQA